MNDRETDLFAMSDALVDEYVALRPMAATWAGVRRHDHRWDDLSPDGHAEVDALLARWGDRIAAAPAPATRREQLAREVMLDWIALERASFVHGDHRTDLGTLASSLQFLRMVFDAMPTSDREGWEAIATRLETSPDALRGYRESLEAGLAAGTPVAARQVRGAVKEARTNAGPGSSFRRLPAAFGATGLEDPGLARRLEAAVDRASAGWAEMADWLEQRYLPRARPTDAVGRERYLRAMRGFLGSTPDPEETAAWGWEEVARVSGEWRRVAARVAPGLGAVEAQEAARKALSAPDRQTFLAAMAERQQLALAAIEPHFDVPAAIRRLDVREAPPGGPPGGAYYSPPSEDLSRPGTLWCSFGDHVGPFPLYDQVATAYHEGFPGHHLQCGVAATLTSDLCRLQRVLARYSGAAEGWALYAERLMGELGGYERPEYELGRLTNELVRACRVVFDIGAHLELPIPAHAPFHPGERWSFALGVEFFRDLAGLPQERAESEVTRYLGWPAQAISYKVGERVILGLRAEWLAARGPGALREFHGRVLACGNVGLDVLRGQVLAEVA